MTIGTCKHNSDWINSCWGTYNAAEACITAHLMLRTVMGTARGIKQLVRALINEVEAVRAMRELKVCRLYSHPPAHTAKHGKPCFNDQAYMNIVVRGEAANKTAWESLKERVKIFKQGSGPRIRSAGFQFSHSSRGMSMALC